jgi:putative NIF3 family GTP cyclohydrolase 1 type 2
LNKKLTKVAVSLEFRPNMPTDADMLLLHHPPIFGQNKEITNPFYREAILPDNLIIYAIHSRIDKSGFMGEAIAEKILYKYKYIIEKRLDDGTVIISLAEQIEINSLINAIKKGLELKTVNVIIKKRDIKRIAVHGGEAYQKHHISDASRENVDLYIGGDMTHHLAEGAHSFEMSFIDISHYSEQEGMEKLTENLKIQFPKVKFEYIKQNTFWTIE